MEAILIDAKGKRQRPVCWACKKIHAVADCPKKAVALRPRLSARFRKYAGRPYADAV